MSHRPSNAQAVRCEHCHLRYWRTWNDDRDGFGLCTRLDCGGVLKVGTSIAEERRIRRAKQDLARYNYCSPS